MGHDSEEATEDEIGKAIALIGVDEVFESCKVGTMAPGLFAVGVHTYVDIKKNFEVLP